jgi:chitodextrinase
MWDIKRKSKIIEGGETLSKKYSQKNYVFLFGCLLLLFFNLYEISNVSGENSSQIQIYCTLEGDQGKFTLFVPSTDAPGQYEINTYLHKEDKQIGSPLRIRNYPITVFFHLSKGHWGDKSNKIEVFNPANPSESIIYNITNLETRQVEIPANWGMKVITTMNDYVSMVLYPVERIYELIYSIDTQPPVRPESINAVDGISINGSVFTKSRKLIWSPSQDNGSPISGIDYYIFNGQKVSTNTYTDNGTFFPADGSYTVSIKAYDKEGNASETADYQFTLDTKINNVAASGITVDSDYTHKTATVSWSEPSDDFGNIKGSGIKGYQAILTQTDKAPQNIAPDSDLITVTQKTFKDLSAKKVYYVWIRAIDRVGNVSAWTSKQFSPQPQPAQITECIPVSKIVNGQPLYAVNLKVSDVDTASYVIKRQEAGKPATLKEVDEVKYDVISGRAFKQVDSGLTKHTQYQYFVYTKNALGELSSQSTMAIVTTANIEPQCKIKGLRQTEVTTNLSFTLGVKTDPEGDPLTYRLYLRSPGGGDGIVVQSWEPKVDDLKVSYTFQDKTDYQWRISCIETNSAFASTEVFASEWNDLTVDTDGIIPVVSNERGLMSETNLPSKKQPLTFTVEFNSKKKFSNYQWDFGDGAIANGATASHNYISLNQYLITVTATDESGVIRKGVRKLYIENTHQGKLYDSEEWGGDHGVYGEVIVPQGMTLTLKPGTNVQMTSPEGSIRVNGTVYAVDLNQGIFIDRQSPLEYWKEIRFEGGGTGTLSGVTVSHAQRGIVTVGAGRLSLTKVIFDSNEIGLNYISGSVTATNSTFKSNLKFGIKNESDYNLPTLTNCIFSGNGVHYVDAAELPFALDELNQPPSSGNVFQ